MEAAITARFSCARMAYRENARATTTIRDINHRLYLLTLKMIHGSVPAITFGTCVSPSSRRHEDDTCVRAGPQKDGTQFFCAGVGLLGAVASTRLMKAPSARRVVTLSPAVTRAVERTTPPAASSTKA